jgi:hypothetical protein
MNDRLAIPGKNNPVVRFFVKLALFLLLVLALDRGIGYLLRVSYFKQSSGFLYRTTYSIDSTRADALIFGSSRANHHYVPQVMEAGLKMSNYNVGRDGMSLFYHDAVLRGVLARYKPRCVILDLKSREFMNDQNSYDALSATLPYYDEHPEMRDLVLLKSPLEKLKLASRIYPFNSSIFSIMIGNTEYNKQRNSDINGFVPLYKTWTGPAMPASDPDGYDMDPEKLRVFRDFLQQCQSAGIPVYVVSSPVYLEGRVRDHSLREATAICAERGVPFFDYSLDTAYTRHPELFSDANHLNLTGATRFTSDLVDKMVRHPEGPLR